jgi:hypothetical protein
MRRTALSSHPKKLTILANLSFLGRIFAGEVFRARAKGKHAVLCFDKITKRKNDQVAINRTYYFGEKIEARHIHYLLH